jgi:hypothetical protein
VQVTVIKGDVDRIFYHIAEQRLFLKLIDQAEIHELRVSGASTFVKSIMLTKPDDHVMVHVQNGRIDKWLNSTIRPAAPPTSA